MVASRSNGSPTGPTDGPDFSRYTRPIDRGAAGWEGPPHRGSPVPFVQHEAKDIGCSHTAIDNAVLRFCEVLGLRKFHVSDETRRKMRACRLGYLRSVAERKANSAARG